MTNLPSFQVRNLGPIAEGTVQLHPLTILIGKNNTGKTYMAQAIYAAYKALERANGPVEPFITINESEDLLDRLHTAEAANMDALHGSLLHKAEDWMHSRLNRVGHHLSNRLAVYFDLDDIGDLKRWRSSGGLAISAAVTRSKDDSNLLFGIDSDFVSSVSLPRVTARDFQHSYVSELLGELITDLNEERFSKHEDMVGRRASSLLAEFLWDEHLLPSVGLDGVAHYLPAGRSGLLEAWTDVVRLRLEQDREGLALSGREPAALGGIALDFLLELQELIRPSRGRYARSRARYPRRKRPPEVKKAALYLERLIDGDVGLARGRERAPSLTYTQGSNSIPVQRASSMVAELAPLLSWINHLLNPGDLLLVDEPEAHMHPEAVLAVAESLVALSQSGVRVLCTTHSSEFLHQVSNCMLRAAPPNEAPTPDMSKIRAEDVGVYRFERSTQSSGTVIVPVEIDLNWGIPEDEHVAVAEHLADETAELVDNLT